jgi:RecQ family ATP-dependent DNA helicase
LSNTSTSSSFRVTKKTKKKKTEMNTKDRKRKKMDETFNVEGKRSGSMINGENSTITNNFPTSNSSRIGRINNIPALPGSSSYKINKDDTANLQQQSSSIQQQDDRSSSTKAATMEIGGEVVTTISSVSSASSNMMSDNATTTTTTTTSSSTSTTSSSFRPKLGLQLSSSNKITNNKSNKRRSSSGRMMTSFSSMSSSSSSLVTPSSLITQSSSSSLSLSSSAAAAAAAVDTLISKEEEQQQSVVLPSPTKKFDNKLSSSLQNNDEKKMTTTVTTTRVNNNSTSNKNKKGKKNTGNDNFVRQNLKNNAGACRGAKNKSSKFSKERRSWSHRGGGESYGNNNIGDDSNYHGSSSNNAQGNNLHAPGLAFDTPAPSKYSQHSSSSSSTSHHDNDDGRGSNGTNRRNYNGRRSNGNNGNVASYVSKMSGLDPLDEFVDGTFHSKKKSDTTGNKKNGSSATTTTTTSKATTTIEPAAAPMCARHQRPCKLIKVKKNTTGNKGRMFYACHMPRGEQCDHFQWADDTIEVRDDLHTEAPKHFPIFFFLFIFHLLTLSFFQIKIKQKKAARETISKNTSFSSFIARQVAAHVDRFRTLTVPELKDETARRGLNKNGKKQQLLMRLAIWTRDELVKGYPEECAKEKMNGDEEENTKRVDDGNMKALCASDEEDSDDNSSTSSEDSSEDELELFDGGKESEVEDGDEIAGYTSKEMKSSNQQLAVTIDRPGEENSLSESLQNIFGHDSFRNGQEWAIQRCLEQKRSLLVAPTGFGKSLCYALPAALMDGVCVVVSPLISLIQDQLRSLPPRIPAATLSGSISASKTAAILDDIVRKRLKILFVSPERLTSPAFRRLFNLTWNPDTKMKERKFPEISLLCIDEAHCISQWAHNFRPCFLRFKGFLKIMKPKSILAITATAGPRVIADIGHTLDIKLSESESVSKDSPEKLIENQHESIKIIRTGRDNIDVMCKFMSNHEERLAVLSGILTRGVSKKHDKKRPYAGKLSKGSVIVYVWRQKDTEAVAESLVAAGVSGGVVVYHGGMDANRRAKSQSRFMRGKARIVVATVAFGLGIDKADIVGVSTD